MNNTVQTIQTKYAIEVITESKYNGSKRTTAVKKTGSKNILAEKKRLYPFEGSSGLCNASPQLDKFIRMRTVLLHVTIGLINENVDCPITCRHCVNL